MDFGDQPLTSTYELVDLSSVKSETDLPDAVSPHAYRAYQQWLNEDGTTPKAVESSTGTFRTRSSIEAIWKIITPAEFAGSYVVMANSHFAVIRPGVDAETGEAFGGWTGTYMTRYLSTYPQVDFTPDKPGCILHNNSIWNTGDDGTLQIAQTPAPTKGYPWSMEGETNFPVEYFRMKRVDFTRTNDPNELTDRDQRSALRTFQQFDKSTFPDDPDFVPIETELPDLTEESIEGVWQKVGTDGGTPGYVVFANGRYSGIQLDEKKLGRATVGEGVGEYSIDSSTTPVSIDFTVQYRGSKVRLLGIGREMPKDSLSIICNSISKDSRPTSFDKMSDTMWSPGSLRRIDWSQIETADQLPDEISRDA